MLYKYVAINLANKKTVGELSAADKSDALDLLKKQSLVPVSVTAIEHSDDNSTLPFWKREISTTTPQNTKIKKKEIFSFLNQMAIMLHSGVSLTLAMDILIDGEKKQKFKRILTLLNEDLYNGIAISEAMKKFKAFPLIIANIVAAGEVNGRLDIAFRTGADLLEKEIRLTGKIRSTMAYPIFLIGLTIAVVGILNVVVLPTFIGIFSQYDAPIPMITQIVMAISDFIMNYWYLIVAAVLAIVIGYKLICKYNSKVDVAKDKFKLYMPAMGLVLRKSYTARFCRILASLVDAGIDIVTALDIASDVLANNYLRQILGDISREIRVGNPLSESMAKYPVFDSLLISMLRVGEESGSMGETLGKMADLYEEQTDEATKTMMALLEPAMTIIIGIVVGVVVVSIMLPMFGMYNVIA